MKILQDLKEELNDLEAITNKIRKRTRAIYERMEELTLEPNKKTRICFVPGHVREEDYEEIAEQAERLIEYTERKQLRAEIVNLLNKKGAKQNVF